MLGLVKQKTWTKREVSEPKSNWKDPGGGEKEEAKRAGSEGERLVKQRNSNQKAKADFLGISFAKFTGHTPIGLS
jgi:hypothetical protein